MIKNDIGFNFLQENSYTVDVISTMSEAKGGRFVVRATNLLRNERTLSFASKTLRSFLEFGLGSRLFVEGRKT